MRFWIPVLIALVSAGRSFAFDYGTVERRLVKEPVYRSKPQYALLLFGAEAHRAAWVVLDGDTLYLDRNGNGDLTERDERFEKEVDCRDVELADADGKTRYVITGLGSDRSELSPEAWRKREAQGIPRNLTVNVSIKGPIEYRQYCDVTAMSHDPKKAMLAHFHGPLTIGLVKINWKVPSNTVIRKGVSPPELRVHVGTMNERYGCWVVVESCDGGTYRFPQDVHPVAEVEFPPRDPQDAPVKRSYALNSFCCASIFKGPIQVPDKVGAGNAKVKLSFDAWPAGAVSPSIVELPIAEPPQTRALDFLLIATLGVVLALSSVWLISRRLAGKAALRRHE